MEKQVLGHFSKRPERLEERVTLPSNTKVTIMETTGKEESVVSSMASKKSYFESINKFLCLVTKDIGDEQGPATEKQIEDLLLGDRVAILLRCRQLSHGNSVQIDIKCNNCETESSHEVDLDPILESIKPYKEGDQREFSIDIDGYPLYFELANGRVEKKIAESKVVDVNRKLFSMRFWEETGKGNLPVDLRNFRSRDLATIRKYVADLEFDIDSNVSVSCPECSATSVVGLLESRHFLFPSMT